MPPELMEYDLESSSFTQAAGLRAYALIAPSARVAVEAA